MRLAWSGLPGEPFMGRAFLAYGQPSLLSAAMV